MSTEQLHYIVDGLTYTLVDGVHTFLADEDGFGLEGLEVAEEATPYEDGAVEVGTYLPPRDMVIAVRMTHDTEAELDAFDDQYQHVLRPSRGVGVLRRVTVDDRTRDIACRLVRYPKPRRDLPTVLVRAMTFHASSPYFYDPVPTAISFALGTIGGLLFGASGAEFADPAGLTFGESDIDSREDVENDGDVAAWPLIRINGPGDNPTIENETTGKILEITQAMDVGDYIDIDMEAGTVEFHDDSEAYADPEATVNIIEAISEDSEFWSLAQGTNTIHVQMSNVGTGSVHVSFYTRYDHV